MKKITLDFDGYWREANKDSIPRQSGIYCVYTCTYNATEHTVSIKKMLYIGESTNVHDRIAAHDRLDDWKKKLTANETFENVKFFCNIFLKKIEIFFCKYFLSTYCL